MKVDETHIFIRDSKTTRDIEVYTSDIEVVRSLITDPKPLLWCNQGMYRWFRKNMIVNAARVMYDQYKSAKLGRSGSLKLSWQAGYELDAELGDAIVRLANLEKDVKGRLVPVLAPAKKTKGHSLRGHADV